MKKRRPISSTASKHKTDKFHLKEDGKKRSKLINWKDLTRPE
jgi:hypothetical protein